MGKTGAHEICLRLPIGTSIRLTKDMKINNIYNISLKEGRDNKSLSGKQQKLV